MRIKDFTPEKLNVKSVIIDTCHGGYEIQSDYDFEAEEFSRSALIQMLNKSQQFLDKYNEKEGVNLTLDSDISEIPKFFDVEFDMCSSSGDSLKFNDICEFIVYEGHFERSKILKFNEIESIGDCKIGYINWIIG